MLNQLLLLCLCAGLSCSTKDSAPSLFHEVILPWHKTFARDTEHLVIRVERFCQNPDNPGEYQALRGAWIAAMHTWAQLSSVTFGPATQLNIASQITYWPDEHRLLEKRIQLALARNTVSALDKDPIGQQDPLNNSNAVTAASGLLSLHMMEILLFDPKFADPQNLTGAPCELLRHASQQMQTQGANLEQAWRQDTNFAPQGQSDALSPTTPRLPELSLQLVQQSLINNLTRLRQHRLNDKVESSTGEFWRSHNVKTALLLHLSANQTLFEVGLRPYLRKPEDGAVIQKLFNQISQGMEDLPAAFGEGISTSMQQHLLTNLLAQMDKLTAQLSSDTLFKGAQ